MKVLMKLACVTASLSFLAIATPALAGFALTSDSSNTMKNETAPVISAEPAESSVPLLPLSAETRKYELSKGIDASAPALNVYQERYVPDTVKKKYNLPPEWATRPGQNVQEAAPTILTPEMPSSSQLDDKLVVISKPSTPQQKVQSWRARKGENIRDVLRRWSERQSVDLMWASPSVPDLKKDFSYVGKFQEAVNLMLKEAGGDSLHSQFRSEGLDPVMMAPASTVTTNLPAPTEKEESASIPQGINATITRAFSPTMEKQIPETRWFALSGAPLSEVLQVWAEDAGISLIWQAESNYALKESISQVGMFEDAVFKALSQYDSDAVRPVGEIYLNDLTGERVLVIRTDASML